MCVWRGGGEGFHTTTMCSLPASGKEDVILQVEVFGPAEDPPPQNLSKVFDQNHCNKKKAALYNFAISGYRK